MALSMPLPRLATGSDDDRPLQLTTIGFNQRGVPLDDELERSQAAAEQRRDQCRVVADGRC
jgi:hypothetical protein